MLGKWGFGFSFEVAGFSKDKVLISSKPYS